MSEISRMLILVLLSFVSVFFCIFMFISLWTTIFRVPWVRTNRRITAELFKMAELQPGEKVVDFGSGDGSMIIDAARDFGAQGIGLESQWFMNQVAKIRARIHGVHKDTDFRTSDFFSDTPPEADVIITYLFDKTNAQLEPILLKHYPSGTRVVTRAFVFPTLELIKKQRYKNNNLHLYRIP